MFWAEGYNVPPCCDQNYFIKLFKNLREKQTEFIYMQSDYPISRIISNVLIHMPMSSVKILLPEITPHLTSTLCALMGRHWYNGKTNDSFMLENLLLVTPESAELEEAKKQLAVFGDRVHIAKMATRHTAILIESNSFRCVFSGTGIPDANMSEPCFTAMCVSCANQYVDEFSTLFRILSHHKL